MVDVPRHPEPSDAERLHTYLARMTPGGAGGQSRAVGPIVPRDVARAQVIGSGEEDSLDSTSSQIDVFAITGTATSTFQLTFDPVDDSWNPTLNGIMLDEGTDYSISGQTLTVTTPADLFKGVTTQGSPWELRVQYDYFTGVPTAPDSQFVVGSLSYAGAAAVTRDFVLPAGAQPGDLVILTGRNWFGAYLTSGWFSIDAQQQDGGDPTIYYARTIGRFLTTEQGGDTITISANVSGDFLISYVGTVVRGVDQSTPVEDLGVGYGTPAGSITGSGNNVVLHHAAGYDTGEVSLTLDRGTQLVQGSGSTGGHEGLYVSSSEEDLSGTVTCAANTTTGVYLVSMVLKRAT